MYEHICVVAPSALAARQTANRRKQSSTVQFSSLMHPINSRCHPPDRNLSPSSWSIGLSSGVIIRSEWLMEHMLTTCVPMHDFQAQKSSDAPVKVD